MKQLTLLEAVIVDPQIRTHHKETSLMKNWVGFYAHCETDLQKKSEKSTDDKTSTSSVTVNLSTLDNERRKN